MKKRSLKSGLPPIAAISGVMKLDENAVTTAPNAAPRKHGDGQVDHVATQDEVAEFLEH